MPKDKLHIDIETYSSVDIMTSGAYKYCASIDFEVLMIAYAVNDQPIRMLDLAAGDKIPQEFLDALMDPAIEKHAHNANFERTAFRALGYDVPPQQWHCSAVKAAYCGLPLSLTGVSEALDLGEKGKLSTGKALIRYFCVPVRPTKTNGHRVRNFWHHNLEKWDEFKRYCINDVVAEREIGKKLAGFDIPADERKYYILDQEINDRGILVDRTMANYASKLDDKHSIVLTKKLQDITRLENPNSPAQLKKWLSEAMQKEITTLAKDSIAPLIEEAGAGPARDVLELRQKASKTSVKKYDAMRACAGEDDRIRGLFQFYGANRTGRWAGRLVQMQNLPQNHLQDLDTARKLVRAGDYEQLSMFYDDISDTLSQLVRTAFVAKPGHTFVVADFSAIEARVIAWFAGEAWRLKVFQTHGKIYEASAAMMFGVPLETVTKGSDLRQKGKVAELALGYQGALGALRKMGGERMGLSDAEMMRIVKLWRLKNKEIVALWDAVDEAARYTVRTRRPTALKHFQGLAFSYEHGALAIRLPSGRKLHYQEAKIALNRFGKESVQYKGVDQVSKKWWWVDSYGGKFVENIVQAFARDLLAFNMLKIDSLGFKIVMHVHDELVVEVPKEDGESILTTVCEAMGEEVPWAQGLPLAADGYITDYYKKD